MRRFVWPMCVAIGPNEGCHYGGHYIYYMVDIDNLNFEINPIKGQRPKGRRSLT